MSRPIASRAPTPRRSDGAARRPAAALAAAVVAVSAIVAPGLAAAANAPPPMKPNPPGLECKKAAAEFGADNLWWGQFSGMRDATDLRVPHAVSVWRCFRTEVDCKNWLYWKNTDFGFWTWVARCDHGFRP